MTESVVMTYNIRNGDPDPGHEWGQRAPLVVEVVQRNAPDVLGLQEVLLPQLGDLERLLPGFDAFGQGRDGGDAGEFCPVLWRRDRFDPVDAGQFWLSDTPDAVGSNTWGSLCARCTTWVRLRPRDGGGEFVFATTHLDHEESAHGDEVRERSALLIGERLGATDAPVVLTGDLNETPDGAAHAALAAAGLRAVTRPGAGPDEPSFHDYGRARHPERIDGIFVTAGIRVGDESVDSADVALAASDHYPVVAALTIG